MTRLLIVALSLAAAICGQSGIRAPLLGFFQDGAGAFRPVYGLAGNLVTGGPLDTGILSAASAGELTWVKTEDRLRSFDASGIVTCELPAPPGPALLADSMALYPETMELQPLGSCRAALVRIEDLQADEVLSFRVIERGRVGILVRRGAGIWLFEVAPRRKGWSRETAMPDITAPVVLRPDGSVVFARGSSLVARSRDGSERTVGTDGEVTRLAEWSDGWIYVATANSRFVLRPASGVLELYRLPEVAQ